MPATNNSVPTGSTLPPGVRCGHVPACVLPAGYTISQRVGQLTDVRCPAGHRYLLAETETHWLLHRRVTPDAPGHARNQVETGPPMGFAKAVATDGE